MKILRFGPIAWELEGEIPEWLGGWVNDEEDFDGELLRVKRAEPRDRGRASDEKSEEKLLGCGEGWRIVGASPSQAVEVVITGSVKLRGRELRAALASLVAREAPRHGALLVHASAVRVKNGVALLIAPKGTGKTTAARAAGERAFAGNAVLVCGVNGEAHALALPFAGDPDPSLDARGTEPVQAIFSLQRAESLTIEWCDRGRATIPLARAVVRPHGGEPFARERAELTLTLASSIPHAVLRTPVGPGYLSALDAALEDLP